MQLHFHIIIDAEPDPRASEPWVWNASCSYSVGEGSYVLGNTQPFITSPPPYAAPDLFTSFGYAFSHQEPRYILSPADISPVYPYAEIRGSHGSIPHPQSAPTPNVVHNPCRATDLNPEAPPFIPAALHSYHTPPLHPDEAPYPVVASSVVSHGPSRPQTRDDSGSVGSPKHSEHSDISHVSSHWSLPNLPESHPLRRVRASTVRHQAAAIPPEVYQKPHYPHPFRNGEQLPFQHNPPPLIEQPLMPDGEMPWQIWDERDADKARIVVNRWNTGTHEVMYHDPTLPRVVGSEGHPFSLGVYRPRVVRLGR